MRKRKGVYIWNTKDLQHWFRFFCSFVERVQAGPEHLYRYRRLRFIKLNEIGSFNVWLIYLHRFIQKFEKSVTAWNHESILNGTTTTQRLNANTQTWTLNTSRWEPLRMWSNCAIKLICALHWIGRCKSHSLNVSVTLSCDKLLWTIWKQKKNCGRHIDSFINNNSRD